MTKCKSSSHLVSTYFLLNLTSILFLTIFLEIDLFGYIQQWSIGLWHKAKKQYCLHINHTRPIRIKNVFKHVTQCQNFKALYGLNSFDRLQSYKTFQLVNSIFFQMVHRPIFRAAWTDTKNAWKQWE